MHRRRFLQSALGLLPQQHAFDASDWPQWRGPNRDGIAAQFSEPQAWPSELHPKWKTEVGSGFSSPIYSQGRVYAHARRSDDEETICCLDAGNGRLLWQKSYQAPFTRNKYARHMGAGPNSTPALAQSRLCTLGMTGILSCFHNDSGELAWRNDFSDRIDTSKYFTGTANSPLIEAGLVLVQIGDDRQGSIRAFELATGTPRWEWNGDTAAYSSPIVRTIAGARTLVTFTEKLAVGLSFDSGKLLWSIPFRDPENENIATPVLHGNLLIVSGIRNGTFAHRLTPTRDRWTTEVVWHNPDVHIHMSSPVLDRGLLFGHSYRKKGQFFCLDAETGATKWITAGREGEHASAICTNSLLFLLTERADLFVVKKIPDAFTLIAKYKVAESETWPHPILLDRSLIVRDSSYVALYSLS